MNIQQMLSKLFTASPLREKKNQTVEPTHIGKHQMSKRGAQHKRGKKFVGKKYAGITPAQYRHFHFGVQEKNKKEGKKA